MGITSTRMSLCSNTPDRIFARVMLAMINRAPIMNPCDHASIVSCAGLDGLDSWAAVVSAILCHLRKGQLGRVERNGGWITITGYSNRPFKLKLDALPPQSASSFRDREN